MRVHVCEHAPVGMCACVWEGHILRAVSEESHFRAACASLKGGREETSFLPFWSLGPCVFVVGGSRRRERDRERETESERERTERWKDWPLPSTEAARSSPRPPPGSLLPAVSESHRLQLACLLYGVSVQHTTRNCSQKDLIISQTAKSSSPVFLPSLRCTWRR